MTTPRNGTVRTNNILMAIGTALFLSFQGWLGMQVSNTNSRLIKIETLTDANAGERRDQMKAL